MPLLDMRGREIKAGERVRSRNGRLIATVEREGDSLVAVWPDPRDESAENRLALDEKSASNLEVI